MKPIGMVVAVLALGAVGLTARPARACEHHRAAKAETPPAEAPPSREDTVSPPHAAKCRCSSAADCTCKKGTCECPRCKKPRQEPAVPARAERPTPPGPPEASRAPGTA